MSFDGFTLGPVLVQVLLTTGAAFLVLTVAASYFRFQSLVRNQRTSADVREDQPHALELDIAHRLGTLQGDPPSFLVMVVRSAGSAPAPDREAWAAWRDLLRARIRREDAVHRHGDGLGLVLACGREHADTVARRLLAPAEAPVPGEPPLPLPFPVVVGMASHPENGTESERLVEAAARAVPDGSGAGHAITPASAPHAPSEPAPPGPDARPAHVDPHTGLLRPSHLAPVLTKYMARYKANFRPVSLMVIEPDGMPEFVAVYGDSVVPVLRRALGTFLEKALRQDDLVAHLDDLRYVASLPGNLDTARGVAERLVARAKTADAVFQGQNLRLGIRVGVAGYPDHGYNPWTMIRFAEAAIEATRRHPRARALVFEESMADALPRPQPADVF